MSHRHRRYSVFSLLIVGLLAGLMIFQGAVSARYPAPPSLDRATGGAPPAQAAKPPSPADAPIPPPLVTDAQDVASLPTGQGAANQPSRPAQAPPPAPARPPQAPAANITSNGTGGGLWNSPATWAGGVVPGAADNVTIANGDTVTIDTAAAALSLTVGQGTSGILRWDSAAAQSLTVGGNVTVATGGSFQSAGSGTVTTHALSIAGYLINNGTIDFSTNSDTAGALITFTGAANTTWTGTGNTDLRQTTGVTLNKGTNSAAVLDFAPGSGTFTVQGGSAAGFLAITNGTFKISGSSSFSNPVFAAAAYTIPATGAIWLNNANATIVGQTGSPNNDGLLWLTAGTYNIGTAGTDAMGAGNAATFTIEGGTLNIAGRLTSANTYITYNQSGGTVNVCTAGGCTTAPSFGFTGATGIVMNISGGTINLVQANTAATPVDYNMTGTMVYTGGTLNIGTAATATNFIFRVQGQMPAVVIDNTTNNKTANLSGQGNVWGNLTINPGTTVNVNPGTAQTLLMIGPTLTNNGAIVVNTNNSGTVNFAGTLQTGPGGGYAQTYTGTGTFGTAALRVATFSVQNAPGVTINAAVSALNIYRINAFYGAITNSNLLAIGAGDATLSVIQRGATGVGYTAGSLDVAPAFNIGSGGLSLAYAQSPTALTTGPEIPATRTVGSIQILNPTGVILAGGALTATNAASALLLSSGTLTTTAANLLTISNTATGAVSGGSAATWVNGPLARTLPASLAAAATYTFPVGKGSFKMFELVNPTTNAGGTVTIQVEAFDVGSGGSAGTGFSGLNSNRYWSAAITSGAANFTNTTVRVTEQGTPAAKAIGQSATQAGAYDSIGGTVTGAVIGPSSTITTLGFFAVGTLTGAPTISGTFTVGVGGAYTTLTAAVADLNAKLMTGPVTFSLTDATYPSETFPITINQNGGNSAANTLTIRPAAGAGPALSGATTSALIILNGIDYVTIDGSNSGGTSRDMSLTNTNATAAGAVIWGQTIGTADPTTNNIIKNLNITGNASITTLVGIGFGSSTISLTSVGTRNDNNRVQNNNVVQLQIGIFSQGLQSPAKNFGTVITGNVLGSAGALALGRAGIYVGFEDGVQITNNTVVNVASTNSIDNFGITLGSQSVTATAFTTNNDVANATVTGNFVGTVLKTDTFSAVGIVLGTTNYGTSRIANNSVYGVNANATPGDFAVGIYVGAAGTLNSTTEIYFNSVSMTGSRDTGGAATQPSFALAILGANPRVNVRNNSLYNTQTAANGATTAGSYAIGLSNIALYNLMTSNYNDLFSSGAASHFAMIGNLNSTFGDRLNLAAWIATTGKDTPNSISADPLYTSATNLQPLPGSPLLAAGQTIAGLTTDILGATRGSPPSIGAYEQALGGTPTPTPTVTRTNTVVPSNTPTAGPSPTCVPLSSWVTGPTLTPGRAFFQGGVAADGNFYVAGGQLTGAGTPVANVDRYLPGSNSWASLAPLPTPASQVSVGITGTKMYVAGGYLGGTAITSTLRIYDIPSNTWSFGASMPASVEAAAGVVFGGKFYVMGGDDFNNSLGTNYIYDIATNTWSTGAPLPAVRTNTYGTAAGGFVYVFGGADAAFAAVDTLFRYDPVANTWATMAPAGTGGKGNYGSISPYGVGKLLVLDGATTAFVPSTTTHIYDIATNTWTAGPNLLLAHAGQAQSLLPDGRVIIASGLNTSTATTTDVELLTTQPCGTVTPTPPAATPTTTRTATTVVATPTCVPQAAGWSAGPNLPTNLVRAGGVYFPANGRFYTMGGRPSDAAGSDILTPYEYNPATNTWTIKAGTFPDNNTSNVACGVLTVGGTPYIYCVGGSFATGTTATGRVVRYNPVTDSFTLMTGDDWPGNAGGTVLVGGVAVANNKLYILGGFTVTVGPMINQIWEYDPNAAAGSRWLQRVNLPVARGYIPATTINGIIYTGGGSDYTTTIVDTADSFRFDPVANTISAIPNIPRATGETRALNIGGRMWVLGGGRTAPNPSTQVDIYDPNTNTWSTGTPFTTARRNFPADTDGTTIWLAGGYAPTTANNTMQIYRPAQACGTATVTPISTSTPTRTATAPTATTTRTATSGIVTGSPTPTTPPVNTSTPTAPPVSTATNTAVPPTVTSTPCPIQFTDVDQNNPFYTFIRCLACRQIVSGYSDGTFRWGNDVTRGQLSKIISGAANLQNAIPSSQQTFEDVPNTNVFWIFIERLAGIGAISGYNCGGPGEPCGPGNRPYFRWGNQATRGQISKITAVTAGWNGPIPTTQQTFEDVPSTNPFWLWIEELASRQVISGYNCGGPGEPCGPGNRPYFRWGNNATRGQMSKIAASSFFPNCQTPSSYSR